MSSSQNIFRLTEQLKEIGFGSKAFENSKRLINKDGSYNVKKLGGDISELSFYHWMINMNWTRYFLMILVCYLFINTLFALLYFAIGAENLTETPTGSLNKFMHCFYFSAQTLTTLGYGRISLMGHPTQFVSAVQAMIGLIGFAFATGITYGRFSKARAKILFSEKILVSPYHDIKGLKLRIANQRNNQIIDISARVIYSFLSGAGDERKRLYRQLDLEIDFINMFPLPWTLVHPINKESPVYGKGQLDLSKEKAEFIIIIKGYDDTFNQYVHQIYSYRDDEIAFNSDFMPMFDTSLENQPVVYLDKISDYQKVR